MARTDAATAAPRTRAELAAWERERLSRGSRIKPEVWRLCKGPVRLLLKDVRALPSWSRPLSRWLLRRERRVLIRLRGVPGVPQHLADLDQDAFLVDWLAGQPLDRERFREDARRLTDRMLAIVAAMHRRRVYHLDLRQRQNLLLGEQGQIALVDFGAALAFGPVRARLFGRLLRWVDRQAVLKHLARYAPAELTVDEVRQVLRALRLRRLWPFGAHHPRDELHGARERLRQHAS